MGGNRMKESKINIVDLINPRNGGAIAARSLRQAQSVIINPRDGGAIALRCKPRSPGSISIPAMGGNSK